MHEQPASSGNRRRTREEVRVGYRAPVANQPAAPPQPVASIPKPAPIFQAPLPPQQPTHQQSQPVRPLKPAAPKQPKDQAKAVSINIQLPELHLKKRLKQARTLASKPFQAAARHRKLSLALVAGTIIISGAIAGGMAFQNRPKTAQGNTVGAAGGGSVSSKAIAAEPTFTPVAPASKPDLGKVGAQSAFDGNRKVYSYIDTINKQRITVSQQQPGTSGAVADAVTASKSLNANKVVATTFGDIYINTNTKYNSQTVIASVKNLLVFLQSSQVIGDSDWKTYIDNLQ